MSTSSKSPEPSGRSDPGSAELMYVKCASCGKWLDVKPGRMNSISHGLCPECYRSEMDKLETWAPGEADPVI